MLIPAMLFMMQQVKGNPFNTYLVTKVIDGDTFQTAEMMNIRFDTLDAPELANCGGMEAKEQLQKLIEGKKVRLDIQARDVNGRQVASVWAGKTWIDQKMIESGWVVYSSSVVDKGHVLQELDKKNEKEKIGLYAEKCTQYTNPDKPKCQIKGNIAGDWDHKGDKIYHAPGCAQYSSVRVEKWRGEEWFCNEKQAIEAGYRKSERCP